MEIGRVSLLSSTFFSFHFDSQMISTYCDHVSYQAFNSIWNTEFHLCRLSICNYIWQVQWIFQTTYSTSTTHIVLKKCIYRRKRYSCVQCFQLELSLLLLGIRRWPFKVNYYLLCTHRVSYLDVECDNKIVGMASPSSLAKPRQCFQFQFIKFRHTQPTPSNWHKRTF